MSRIRSIKPEWLDDELLTGSSDAARVLSIALICLADDYGNGRAGRIWLASRVFPGRPLETIDDALSELVRVRYVQLYEVDGQRFFAIRTWDKNQRVDKPGLPKVPRPTHASDYDYTENIGDEKVQELPETSQEDSRDSRASRASLPLLCSDNSSSLAALPDQPVRSGNARARRKASAKTQLVPFPMHDAWEPPAELVSAVAELFSVKPARVAATNAEFRRYWKQRGSRKNQANWERTYRNNAERMAKTGALYAEPQAPPANPGFRIRTEHRVDEAEERRSRRNNLIEEAKCGRYGPKALAWAESGKNLAGLADKLESAPRLNVTQSQVTLAVLTASVGKAMP